MKHSTKIALFICLFFSSQLFAQSVFNLKQLKIDESTNNIYLTIKPDLRKCVSPICGGWIVNPVNQHKLRCTDGTVRKECYVGTDEVNIPNLTDKQLNELRQMMSASRALIYGNLSNKVEYGLLEINAAWLGAGSQPAEGKFVSVSDNGIRCITYPCPTYDAKLLNRRSVKSIASYDLREVDAGKDQLALAQGAVLTDDGLHLAGKFVEVSGPAGVAQGIKASQFYLKLKGETPKMCAPTGCSGQICSDQNVITTCEWKPEYECYRAATCSTQVNGECGWEMDETLRQCLANTKINNLLMIDKPL